MKARVSLNLPNSLKKAAEDFAAKDGVSLNQYVALALAEKIGARGRRSFSRNAGRTATRRGRWRFWRGGRNEGGVRNECASCGSPPGGLYLF